MNSNDILAELVDDILISLIHRLAGAPQYNTVVDHLSTALSILRAGEGDQLSGRDYVNRLWTHYMD